MNNSKAVDVLSKSLSLACLETDKSVSLCPTLASLIASDPVKALPKSSNKKFVKRQNTWSAGSHQQNNATEPKNTSNSILNRKTNDHLKKKLDGIANIHKNGSSSTPSSPTVNEISRTGSNLHRQQSLPSKSSNPIKNAAIVPITESSARETILAWCQTKVNGYPNVHVTNLSLSWNDGLAFCALIHFFHPEAFDFDQLKPENRRYNFALAFKTAEIYADIYPLLDVDDMVRLKKPDWKCVFTYVQSFYRKFRNVSGPIKTLNN